MVLKSNSIIFENLLDAFTALPYYYYFYKLPALLSTFNMAPRLLVSASRGDRRDTVYLFNLANFFGGLIYQRNKVVI